MEIFETVTFFDCQKCKNFKRLSCMIKLRWTRMELNSDSKINYEHREILLKNRPNKLYEISPKGTVPVLDLLNGEVIDESFDIMKWAISMDSSETLFNRGRQKQIGMILLNDMQFKKCLDK